MCRLCANCCKDSPTRIRRILFTEYDLKRIQRLELKIDFYHISEHSIGPYFYEMVKKNGSCIFLTDNKCSIYNDRPLICRFYPFTLNKNTDYVFQADYECEGIGFNKLIKERLFKELIEEAERTLK